MLLCTKNVIWCVLYPTLQCRIRCIHCQEARCLAGRTVLAYCAIATLSRVGIAAIVITAFGAHDTIAFVEAVLTFSFVAGVTGVNHNARGGHCILLPGPIGWQHCIMQKKHILVKGHLPLEQEYLSHCSQYVVANIHSKS